MSSHHTQEVSLAQFSLYVYKGGLTYHLLFAELLCLGYDTPNMLI